MPATFRSLSVNWFRAKPTWRFSPWHAAKFPNPSPQIWSSRAGRARIPNDRSPQRPRRFTFPNFLMNSPHNTSRTLVLYQLQPPYNPAISGLSLGALEDSIRRALVASKRFPDPQATVTLAGHCATIDGHVRRALALSRRFDAAAGGLWRLVGVQAQIWHGADFATRLLFDRAIYPSLRATIMSRSAIASGASGEWFFVTSGPPPVDLLAPCPTVKTFIERTVSAALGLESAEIEVTDRWGRRYICATQEGLYRVKKLGPPATVF